MTPAERKHLREAERIVRTVINHERGIDTDGSYRCKRGLASPDDYAEATRINWNRIRDMIREWL
jgi:acetyl-CoA carboxylase alpha subunit